MVVVSGEWLLAMATSDVLEGVWSAGLSNLFISPVAFSVFRTDQGT